MPHIVRGAEDGHEEARCTDSAAALRVSAPSTLAILPTNLLGIDATPDRQHFLALVPERTGTGSITVVENWRAALAPK